jgi:hypothetical protein
MKKSIFAILAILSTALFADTTDVEATETPPKSHSTSIYDDMTSPTNLTTVNSTQSDFAPYISASGKVLYFSTNRDDDQEDFYISEFSDNRWQTPIPLGPPIGTAANEGSMAISADGNTIIFTACGRTAGCLPRRIGP